MASPKRSFQKCYTKDSYARAIKRGAKKAGVDPWSPYQLRKMKATELDRTFGPNAAAAALGHKNVQTTLDHYIDPRIE